MDDRSFYLCLAILAIAALGMVLDAALAGFNVDPGFYPFLGIFAGALLGRGVVRSIRDRKNEGDR